MSAASSRNVLFDLFMIPVALMGIAAIGFAIWWLANIWQVGRHSQRTQAVVTKLDQVRHHSEPRILSPGDAAYAPGHTVEPATDYVELVPVVRFQYEQSETEVRVRNYMHPVGTFSVGQTVMVVFPTGKPDEARIPSFSENFLVPLVFGGTGLVLVAGATVTLMMSRRRNQSGIRMER